MEDALPKQVSEFGGYSKKEWLWHHRVIHSQVKLADTTATGISSPAFSLPRAYFPLDPMPCHPWCHREVSCSCTVCWAGKPVQDKAMPGKGAWLGQTWARYLLWSTASTPTFWCQNKGEGNIESEKNEGDGRMGLLLLASVLDQNVCGTKASECQVWISWINVVKPWIKSYSGRELALAYSKQHPLLIQSGSWNTGNKCISFLLFLWKFV